MYVVYKELVTTTPGHRSWAEWERYTTEAQALDFDMQYFWMIH